MKLFNSLTQSLDEFKSLSPKRVTIYVCGITPYDTTHLGHTFTYISFDTLIRYLKFQGYEVTYTQNVTDINDRDKDILQKAKEQNTTWEKLAKFWTKKFLSDMETLNWVRPTHYLYASKEINSMIILIQKLLAKNLAYKKNGSVYLDISKFPSFGKLSKLNKEEMLQKAKEFEEDLDNPEKNNPLDITLWRASKPDQPPHIPSFKSPWGQGRPGWHIECSAMSISSLGQQIDIHGGGKDLIFPHHEAEIIQSEGATNKVPFVKYWMHTGVVYFKGEKMSKSKGNLVMVSDLLKTYSANAIRWLLLSHHWRETWEFKEKNLKKAQENVDFIESVITRKGVKWQSHPSLAQISQIMNQDLNTPKMLQLLLRFPHKRLYKLLGFSI